MKLSIITATFNSELTIKTCLDSVICQDYSNIEFLIIDGQSSDNTLSIVKDYQKKFSYIKLVSEKDYGIYDALNKGIRLAKGQIIGFVHSDDMLANNHIISDLVNQLQKAQLDGIYGDLQYVDKINIHKVIRLWKSCEFMPGLLEKGWMPPHPTLFLKKEIYEKFGVFDLKYKIAADYDFMLRVLKDNSLKFGYLPKVITNMRTGGASNRNFKNIIQKTKEDYKAIRSNQIGSIFSILRKNTSKIKQFIFK